MPFFGCLLSRIKENVREPAKSRECFIRQYHPAGEECQFDWGDVKLKIHGRRLTVRMTVFTLPHSNHRTAYLFLRENTLAFMESHRNYFHDIGRIPKRMVYDNMRVAVKVRRMWTTDDKEPTDALLSMSSFYGFDFRFCNARSGNEKGNVEESVKFVRKYVFSVRDEFDSLGEAQDYLSAGCAKLNTQNNRPATADIVSFAQCHTSTDGRQVATGERSKGYFTDRHPTGREIHRGEH